MSFNKAKILKSAEKYVQQGKIAAAIDEYRKIVEADPNDLTMINTLGDLCVRAGRTEEAIQNFSRIAESYRENGFTLKAIAMYKKISKLEPSNYETSLKLADLYAKQGLIVDARQQYLTVADAYKRNGQTKRALEVLQKIADLDPENTIVRLKLAESYQTEGLNEEAHDAYVYAGQEFFKKGRIPDSISALNKALGITPESKSALKTLADAYVQQNDPQRALNVLGVALEKNPGDTDLMVILGRTYLNIKMLGESEKTFSRLLDLDKSRYDYLIQVGRAYLEAGQFDRVIAVIDRCLDLLIARRQEEKAISLLKGILEYDANNIAALKRLADIYTRVREDHNLASTLNLLVDASLRQQLKTEAVTALRQLVELEPDEASHKQRLASLGVVDAPPPPSYSIPLAFDTSNQPPVAATVPLTPPPGMQSDMQSADKQLREAEMFANRGYADTAADILEDLVNKHPRYIEARLKLKELYIDGGQEDKAATQCLELARLYEEKGDRALAGDLQAEAYELNPRLNPAGSSKAKAPSLSPSFTTDDAIEIDLNSSLADLSFGDPSYMPKPESRPEKVNVQPKLEPPRPQMQPESFGFGAQPGGFGFQPQASSLGMPDLFNTGSTNAPLPLPDIQPPPPAVPSSFEALFSDPQPRFSNADKLPVGSKGETPGMANASFEISISEENPTSSTQIAKDKILKDELEGVDFYIAQGYMEIARDTLDNLERQYPNNPAIIQRFAQLGIDKSKAAAYSSREPVMEEIPPAAISEAPVNATIPLSASSYVPPPPIAAPPTPANGSLFDNLVSDIEHSLEEMPTIDILPMASANDTATPVAPPISAPPPENKEVGLEDDLISIFNEFKSDLEENDRPDFETHYNLGLAYKDMELFDDAIEEFQVACKASSPTGGDGRYFDCCNMLGFCFLRNNMARPSVVWYKRGLDAPGRSEEEHQAMRFDLAIAYEHLGEYGRSLEYLQEVYAVDINYRDVASKIREIQDKLKNA